MRSPLRPSVRSAQGTLSGRRKRCTPTRILFFPAAASRGPTPAGVRRARGLAGVVSVRKGCPWQRRAQGAQWIRRSERKTADTHTEGWRARAGMERSRRAHRLLAEARWPGQKPGCQAAPAAVPGGPPVARGQLPSE